MIKVVLSFIECQIKEIDLRGRIMVSRKTLKNRSKEQLTRQWKIPVLITLIVSIIQVASSYAAEASVENTPIYILLFLLNLFITLSIGIMINSFYLKVSRDKKVKFSDMLIPWKTYRKGMIIQLLIVLMCVPIIIIMGIAVGIVTVKYSNYVLASALMSNSTPSFGALTILILLLIVVFCIPIVILELYLFPSVILVCEDNNRGIIQCIKESFRLMKGNVWRLFVLQLSFIGWGILCIIPVIAVGIITSFTFNEFIITILPTIAGIGFLWLAPYISTTLLNFFNEISGDTNSPIYNEITSLN